MTATRPRTGWLEARERGIHRAHSTGCPASAHRRPGTRCDCPYTFWLPREGSPRRRRARVFGTLNDTRRAKQKAEEQARDRRRVLSNQQAGIVPVPTLDEWFDTLMERSWGQKRVATRERRIVDYDRSLRTQLGELRIDRITPANVERWLYDEIASEGNRRFVYLGYETLREMLQIALRQSLIMRNPVAAVPYPIAGIEQREKRVLTLEQYQQLLASARDLHDRTLLRVLCEAGLRRGEAMGLQLGDLNLDEGYIHIQRRYLWTRTGELDIDLPKNGKARVVAINNSLCNDLRTHVATLGTDTPPDTLLWTRCTRFTDFQPQPMTGSSMVQILTRTAIHAGLTDKNGPQWIGLHVLRRTGASIAVAAGVSPMIAKEQLGHAHMSTTEKHYLRLPELAALQGYGAVFG